MLGTEMFFVATEYLNFQLKEECCMNWLEAPWEGLELSFYAKR